jgi:transmembrane sensor
MVYNRYKNFETEDFVLDEYFIRWILHPDAETDTFWHAFSVRYPEKQQTIKEASWIINSLKVSEPDIPSLKLETIYKKLPLPVYKHSRRRLNMLIKIAAALIFLVSVGGFVYYFLNNSLPQPLKTVGIEVIEKGKIILPDGTVRVFDSKETKITQLNSGSITVNDEKIELGSNKTETGEPTLVQVIIPYGMRSRVTLSDGTKIWLNSGSQLSYPEAFKGNSREILLTGEAYFDVEPDPSKPFYVVANKIKLKVLGTHFNVTSYGNDQTTQAVVVEGKVAACRNILHAKSLELNPGERIVYNKQDESFTKDRVDVNLYISWINGYLLLNKEPLDLIFRKMERYYNKKIQVEARSIPATFSGKLDLSEDIDKIFDNISFTTSLKVSYENEVYTIKY